MDELQFYILFNSISVISGQCERQWNPVYGWKDFCLQQGSNPGPLDQQASAKPTDTSLELSCQVGSNEGSQHCYLGERL